MSTSKKTKPAPKTTRPNMHALMAESRVMMRHHIYGVIALTLAEFRELLDRPEHPRPQTKGNGA